MPRKLVFVFDGDSIAFEMQKVDRSRLYGFKEIEVLDESGSKCELATLADDGKTLIGKGGTGVGYLTADGEWSSKEELKAVDVEGREIKPVISSFAAPIELDAETTFDDYLNHNMRLIYTLSTESPAEGLYRKLKGGAIFRFDYSYRGGLFPDHGFLLMNEANEIFFLVGDSTNVEFLGLQQSAAVFTEGADESEEETFADDLMDFGMI
jgi:hypothetical protein